MDAIPKDEKAQDSYRKFRQAELPRGMTSYDKWVEVQQQYQDT